MRPKQRQLRPHPMIRMSRRRALLLSHASALLGAYLLVVTATAVPPNHTKSERALADAFQKKLDHIESNAKQTAPSTDPTSFPEDEINAYFAQGRVKVPEGV